MSIDMNGPQRQQDRRPIAAGQDEVEGFDRGDNLQDADTLADLSDPRIDSAAGDDGLDALDGKTDGDRQLTTDSEAIDGGLNDSDLGADMAGVPSSRELYTDDGPEGFTGLGPDAAQTGGGQTGDRATGVTDLRG